MERKSVLGFYDYTVVLTYLGMFFAFFGILEAIDQNFAGSSICLMVAGICDMFDGTVASTKDRNGYEKHFGIEIDSMCDLISFGILPAVFVYMIFDKSLPVGIFSSIYVLCALIRLSYFNVQELDRQKETEGRRTSYLGLPVTSAAILFPLLYLADNLFNEQFVHVRVCYVFLLMIMAGGFISSIEIKKPELFAKATLIIIGILEFLLMFLLSGADIL